MKEKRPTFEDHLKGVEEAVRNLESGKLGLEESIECYEAGMQAIRKCQEILEEAEKRIQQLVKDRDGKPTLKSLDS